MEMATCFSSTSSSSSSGLATKLGSGCDHIPYHAQTQINGYGSFLGCRRRSRVRAVVVAGGSASSSTKKTAVNGYVGPGSSADRLISTWSDSCLVVPPPTGKKPRAIIKFLGGAFIGAVPELTYRSQFLFCICIIIFYFLLGP